MRLAVLLTCLLAPVAASAADDATVSVDDQGRVVARIHVPASSDEVKAVLADAKGTLADLSPDTLSVETSADGDTSWTARFRGPSGEEVVSLRREDSGQVRPASCGGDAEPVMTFLER